MPRSPSTVRRLLHSKLCRTGSPVACRKWTVLDVLQFIHAPGAATGFRVHVGVLHIRLLMSLTHLSASELAVDLGLCLVARLNLGKAGCRWAHRAKSRWSPPASPASEGLGPRRSLMARSIIFLRRQVPRCTRLELWWRITADDSAEDDQCFLLRWHAHCQDP